ncbi:MAG: PH domain-containing protein [Eubacterium sp.]|nr:PH domain-containing protein [Eubacterium sp.]
MKHTELIWQDRKRNFLGLPWTFTKYALTEDRLFIDTGFLNQREDDVRLYRITDLTLTRSLWQRIIGTGTIHCDSADQTMKNFDIKNVKNAFDVKETLSELVEKCRLKSRVIMGESVNQHHDMPIPGIHPDDVDFESMDADMPCDDLDSH